MSSVRNQLSPNLSWLEEEKDDYFNIEFDDNEQFSDSELHHSQDESDTDQSEEFDEITEEDQDVEDNDRDDLNNNIQDDEIYLLGKDKKTMWFYDPSNHKVRVKKHNLVIRVPGPRGVAKEAKTILDCWELFFDNAIIEKIVQYTNIYFQKIESLYRGQRDSTPTNVIEIRALFGLLYFLGMRKAAHLNLKDLWITDGTAPDCYRAVMSYGRFCTLLSAVRLDNINDRDERKRIDNLAAVQIFDNYFTSVPLVLDLLKNHKTTAVGTIRSNKREIPSDFVNVKNREVRSSKFLFTDSTTLMSYVPKKSKNVLLISTLHNDSVIDKSTGNKKKPEILSFYNVTKGAVDTVDEMKSNYNVARETHRWPMVILYSFLNIAAINSHIIWKANVKLEKTRRDFIKELSTQLFQPQLERRMELPNLSSDLRRIISKVGNIPETSRKQTYDGLCSYCPRRKNSRTKKNCSQCATYLCGKHTILYCSDCVN